MPDNLFSVKQASEAMGVSRQSIRAYTATYARFFSTEATPEQGSERRFTRDDLKLIAYISTSTAMHGTHDEIVKSLERGDLELFRCEVPDAPPSLSEPRQDANTSVVPISALQAAQALMIDAQEREKAAREQAQALQERIEQLQREMGKAEGKIEILEAQLKQPQTQPPQAKGFWRRLLGSQ